MAEQKPKFEVLATHGFIKKTQKTPLREIQHAQSIMDIYFNQK